MQFGVKTTDEVVEIGGGNQTAFIRYFKENGSHTMRFLEPFSEWIAYWEHYSEEFRCSYPCTANKFEDRKSCPGCQMKDKHPGNARAEKESKVSKKYLVNAIRTDDPDTDGYVNLWKIPGSLRESLELSFQKDKIMWKREYQVVRFEKSGRVNYMVHNEDPTPFDPSLYEGKLHDKQAALLESWEYRWKTAKSVDAAPEVPAIHAAEDTEKPPFDEPAKEEEVSEELGEAQIRAMDAETLKGWFKRAAIPIPDTDDTKVLAETFISALEG